MRKRVHVRKRTQPIFIRGCNLLYEQIALDYGASLFWSLSGTTGESFRFDLSRPRIRPAWSNEAACFVHAAGSCHLPQEMVRSHQLPKKQRGFEILHDAMLLTIFSASSDRPYRLNHACPPPGTLPASMWSTDTSAAVR